MHTWDKGAANFQAKVTIFHQQHLDFSTCPKHSMPPKPPKPLPYRADTKAQFPPPHLVSDRDPVHESRPSILQRSKAVFDRLFPAEQQNQQRGPNDPVRGAEASRRVVREGILDPKALLPCQARWFRRYRANHRHFARRLLRHVILQRRAIRSP